jgi:glycine oxidase
MLRARSADLYPIWSAKLKEMTGIDNGFRVSGGLDVALLPKEEPALQSMTGRWRKQGIRFEIVDEIIAKELEPELTTAFARAYFLPERAQIRNPWHLRALEAACRIHNVNFQPHTEVLKILTEGDRVKGIQTESGCHNADSVVVTAGAWSELLLKNLGIQMPTRPVKGQMLLLDAGKRLISRIIEHEKCYLVPRDEGLILAGATEEFVGFDDQLTTEAYRLLQNEAVSLIPKLAEAKVVGHWCGFRPGSKDSRPYLGQVSGIESLYVATGHQRAGLSLSPATAESMADLITDRLPTIELSGYRIDRPAMIARNEAVRS